MESTTRSVILFALSDDQHATIFEIAERTGVDPKDVFAVCMESGSQRKLGDR
ncbi:MAG: hypothetical protein VYB80_04660 [Actinomycetota bacterium]|nr:hypothetical protein [Actinomycetota bacterium]